MSSIVFIALKDLRLLTRDRFGLFWVLFFPLAMALMLVVLMGVVWTQVFLDERLTLVQIVGGGLILTSAVLSARRLAR